MTSWNMLLSIDLMRMYRQFMVDHGLKCGFGEFQVWGLTKKYAQKIHLFFSTKKLLKKWYPLVNVYKKLMGKIHHAINGKIHELNHHFQ